MLIHERICERKVRGTNLCKYDRRRYRYQSNRDQQSQTGALRHEYGDHPYEHVDLPVDADVPRVLQALKTVFERDENV